MAVGVDSELDGVISTLGSIEPGALDTLTDPELHDTLRQLGEATRLLQLRTVQVLGRMDARRSFEADGAKSAAAWTGWQTSIPVDDAAAMVRCARRLRAMPSVADAFDAGTISMGRVGKLASCQATNPERFAAAEADLLEAAETFDDHDLKQVLDYWKLHADPDGSQKDAERRYAARWLSIVAGPDGMVQVHGQLDPVTGAKFLRCIEAIERGLFHEEWDEAKAVHGDDTCVTDLDRTPRQRSHDAVGVMVDRASMVTPGTETDHAPRPLITVLVGEETLMGLCETEEGTILDVHELLPLLSRAEFERVIFDGPSKVVDVGVKQRLFTGGTRRAVQVRDRECDNPSCHDPVTYADVHHITEYGNGGETVQDNGKIYCRWHHRWHHRQPPPAA